MSEEVENQAAEAAPEVNETETKAREQGWVPKDEWQGEGKWRDAEAFLDRGELFQKIDAQRREVRELRKTQESFNAHLKTVREAEFKRAAAALRAEKKEALIDGNPDAVVAADDKILALHEEARKIAAQESVNTPGEAHPDFVAWNARNTWYSPTNRAMKDFADNEGIRLAQRGLAPAEVLKEVEAQVRKEFPEKFTNPNRSRPGAVESSANKGTNSNSKDSYPLSDDERNVMNRLIKSGTLTKDQYIADLKAAKGEK